MCVCVKEGETLIKFVPVDRIRPDDTLARDIYGIDTFTGRVVMLKEGQTLTVGHVSRIMGLDLQGIYIYEKVEVPQVVAPATKEGMVDIINLIYSFSSSQTGLVAEKIGEANLILEEAINEICSRRDLSIDINSLNLHDDISFNHTLNVTVLSIAIGKELGLKKPALMSVAAAAILHDIGDSQIPEDILNKPGKLTDEEFEIIKKHPKFGYELISDTEFLSERTKLGVLYHHERFDGNGYPDGLSGRKIPLIARIIAVADVYSALTASRPYRLPFNPAEAIEYIMGNAGRQFDHKIVEAFLHVVSPYPIGSCVMLSNGEKAIISAQHPENPLRPVVFLMEDPTTVIDLYKDKCFYSIVITEIVND